MTNEKTQKERKPRFEKVKLYRLFIALGVLVVFFLVSSTNRSMNVKSELNTVTLASDADLYSNFPANELNNEKLYCTVIGQVRAGTEGKVLETYRSSTVKLLLPDDRVGWVDVDFIEPLKETYVDFNYPGCYKDITAGRTATGEREIIKEIKRKTAVTRVRELRENNIDWTYVRTKKGVEGWIQSRVLYAMPVDNYRWIDRKEFRFLNDRFIKKWTGRSIEKFEDKFKEAHAIINEKDAETYYFNNITLIDKEAHKRRYGLIVTVENERITAIETKGSDRCWSTYLPMSNVLQSNFFSNAVGNYHHFFEGKEQPLHEEKEINNKFIRGVVLIVILLLAAYVLYCIMEIPFHLINMLGMSFSKNRERPNNKVYWLVVLVTILIAYPYYVFMVVNIYPFFTIFWITTLFFLGMMFGNILGWRNDLDYCRCDAEGCRLWTGIHNGTEYLGSSTIDQHVRFSNGRTEHNQQTTHYYLDHRLCTNCGHEWSIKRTETWGNLRRI